MNEDRRPDEERLHDLLAGRDIDDLSDAERSELDALLESVSREPPPRGAMLGELLVLLDRVEGDEDGLPPALRDRLARQGRAMLGAGASANAGQKPASGGRGPGSGSRFLLAMAAVVAVAGAGVAVWAVTSMYRSHREAEQLAEDVREREAEAARLAKQLEAAAAQADENERLLADARRRVDSMRSTHDAAIAEAEARRLELAERLASLTDELDEAKLAIARYEAPVDPAELAVNRRKLLDVPGTVRLAWSPFDVAGLPDTEQRGDVTGDVVWNDDLQTGYLRFVGLDPNDPNIEQYQVWIIDERGMEQKVSGGIFNANAEGEIIVPIHPGIDVGRVALFAVTVEDPGGTWVPDLQRRVVVAPREEG